MNEKKRLPPLGGLEPPAFRLTAERASQLRHRGIYDVEQYVIKYRFCPSFPLGFTHTISTFLIKKKINLNKNLWS